MTATVHVIKKPSDPWKPKRIKGLVALRHVPHDEKQAYMSYCDWLHERGHTFRLAVTSTHKMRVWSDISK